MTLPEWKTLRKRCKKTKIDRPSEQHFSIADEFVTLKSVFITESLLDTASVWIDMIIYPLYILVRLCMLDFSPFYVLSLMKSYQLWIDWFRFKELGQTIKGWTKIVKSVNGPWISTNDPDYHVFVYADGMERIKHSLKPRIRKTG
jgi:hypothetical protein